MLFSTAPWHPRYELERKKFSICSHKLTVTHWVLDWGKPDSCLGDKWVSLSIKIICICPFWHTWLISFPAQGMKHKYVEWNSNSSIKISQFFSTSWNLSIEMSNDEKQAKVLDEIGYKFLRKNRDGLTFSASPINRFSDARSVNKDHSRVKNDLQVKNCWLKPW